MFGWLRKNKPRQVPAEKTGQEITRIVGTYTALLEKHPLDIMDASWLPADKQKMTHIFRVLWLAASADNNDKMRRETESYWCLLSHFQPGVGEVPLAVDISKDNPTVEEWRKRKERVEPFMQTAVAEKEIYEREIELLRRQQRYKPDQQPERSVPRQEAEREEDTPLTSLLTARAPPWNRVAPIVIKTILAAITDKALLEAFAFHSMRREQARGRVRQHERRGA